MRKYLHCRNSIITFVVIFSFAEILVVDHITRRYRSIWRYKDQQVECKAIFIPSFLVVMGMATAHRRQVLNSKSDDSRLYSNSLAPHKSPACVRAQQCITISHLCGFVERLSDMKDARQLRGSVVYPVRERWLLGQSAIRLLACITKTILLR